MADTGIFATTAEVGRKAGAHASTTSNAETYINDYMTQAESYINTATNYNWSDAYSTLNVDVKGILKQAASCLAAIDVILYDTTGYLNNELNALLNGLYTKAQDAIKELKILANREFVQNA